MKTCQCSRVGAVLTGTSNVKSLVVGSSGQIANPNFYESHSSQTTWWAGGDGNDEWGAGFVDEDGVDFVDDSVVVHALGAVLDAELHVVAEVVEAELVVGAVGDVGVVGVLALLVVEVVENDTHLEAEELVEAAHPFGVAAGEVVVDGDDVNALACEGVQVARQGGDEGLAFTGLHFGDLALVEHHAAHQLNVEMAHIELAAAGLADHGKGWNQEVVH